jgi:hypothetical protein
MLKSLRSVSFALSSLAAVVGQKPRSQLLGPATSVAAEQIYVTVILFRVLAFAKLVGFHGRRLPLHESKTGELGIFARGIYLC